MTNIPKKIATHEVASHEVASDQVTGHEGAGKGEARAEEQAVSDAQPSKPQVGAAQPARHELLSEAQKQAWDAVDQHDSWLRWKVYQRLRSYTEAKEIVARLREKISSKPDLWKRDPEHLRNYLRVIATNMAFDRLAERLRHESHVRMDDLQPGHCGLVVEEDQALDFAAIDLEWRRAFIARLLQKLKPKLAAVVQQFCHGHSFPHIAELLNIPEKTARNRFQRAVVELRRIIDEETSHDRAKCPKRD